MGQVCKQLERARPATLRRVLCAALLATGGEASAQWTHSAADASRSSRVATALPALTAAAWVCGSDASGNAITFLGQTSLVCDLDRVYAIGRVSPAGGPANQWKVFAISRRTGTVEWGTPVAPPLLESTASPALHTGRGEVVVATGAEVRAISTVDGAVRWTTPLSLSVVNGSPLVTSGRAAADGTPRDRVFVTDFDGFGVGATLYCLNASDWHAVSNAYALGEIVWAAAIGGASGATPAYRPTASGGEVVVATVGEYDVSPGRVMAFDVDQPGTPTARWIAENPAGHGFFSGPTLSNEGGSIAAYVASYAFFGDASSANLLKIDARSGAVIWSTPANRTNSTPVVIDHGLVMLSAGVNGYGTVRNLTLYRDAGLSAVQVWNSISAPPAIGGRLQQPVLAKTPVGDRVVVAAAPMSAIADTGYSTELYVIDPSLSPGAAGFVAASFVGAAGGVIATDGNIYAVGPAGIHAFGPTPARSDVNGDGIATIDDLYAWEGSSGARDVDQSGGVTAADRVRLLGELRLFERRRLTEGRR